jgi:hypothetical protein
MSNQLNVALQAVPSGTAVDFLNSGSLSGSVGISAQPKIHVTGVSVTNTDTTNNWDFKLFKGASGASVAATIVLHADVPAAGTAEVPLDVVLDVADFLTGFAPQTGANGKLVLNIQAQIYF